MSKNETLDKEKNLKRECKFVVHVPKATDADGEEIRPDLHFVKEVIFKENGEQVKNLRIIKDFQKPFYITKPHFQNHEQKKESDLYDNDIIKVLSDELNSRTI